MSPTVVARTSIAPPIIVTLTGLLLVGAIAYFLRIGTIPSWSVSQHKLVNFTLTMQLLELPVSFLAIAFTYFYNREGFKTFFRMNISFSNNEWSVFGPIIALAFTLGTALMMSM